jgi:hypothetical protein
MLVKKARRKIPRNAVEPLMQTCEWLSEEWGEPATEIFKRFLRLMNKYADYLFNKPWPKKYDYDEATTFADEDLEFLFESDEGLLDRFHTMCLKKNMCLEHGFMGYFGMFWTEQAFREKFFRPTYKPVLEAFDGFAQGDEDARSVLNKLKKQFEVRLIHNSLVDLVEHEYLDKARDLLVARTLELIHREEGLPPCWEYRCKLQREMLHENRDKSANV